MNLEKKIKRLVILMAMEEESAPIIEALEMQVMNADYNSKLPFKCFGTDLIIDEKQNTLSVFVMTSGVDPRYQVDNIGTQAATLMAHTAIESLRPDLLISAGTAGGFSKRGAVVGTVYLSDKEFVFHDRRVPIAGFDESGVGRYPALDVRRMATQLNLPFGVVSTGSSLQKSELDLAVIEWHGAVAKEMEAAAIAWVCSLHQQAFIAVKSITNLLDETEASEQQFLDNFSTASRCLSEQLQRVIRSCAHRTLSSLGES